MFTGQDINIIEDAEGVLRVSSLIIAGRTDNQHKNVVGLINAHRGDFDEFGPVAFETRVGNRGGSPVQIAHLNEQQATLLITYMRNSDVVRAFKLELVKQFYLMRQELAKVPALSEQEIVHQALQITARQVKELEAKVEQDAPKVEYVDTYVADNDLRLLRNVAKSIGIAESELRHELLERRWIYAEHMTRWSESKQEKETITRYSPYSHKAQYFEPVPNHYAPRFKGEVMHTLKITPAGATAIARMFGRVEHLDGLAAELMSD